MEQTNENPTSVVDISQLSAAQLEAALQKKKEEERSASLARRDAYEGIKAQTVNNIESKVRSVVDEVKGLYDFVTSETLAFYEVMKEYGALRKPGQLSFSLQDDKFKIEVKTNKIKKFDERADIAAAKLIEFLRAWISNSEKGVNDPMYQLAMTLIERNQNGDLDYKSISKLYDLEVNFNSAEYTSIMQLFKESNVIEGTATNFYFWEKTGMGVWRRIEPSFNRL